MRYLCRDRFHNMMSLSVTTDNNALTPHYRSTITNGSDINEKARGGAEGKEQTIHPFRRGGMRNRDRFFKDFNRRSIHEETMTFEQSIDLFVYSSGNMRQE